MKKEDKDQWCAALRSGDYKQGKGFLYRPENHSFCCLGVLADLHGKLDGSGTFVGAKPDSAQILPTSWLRELGLPHAAACDLMVLNDENRATFAEIATWIERNVP